MNLHLETPHLTIGSRELLRLEHPRGVRIGCVSGSLWITQDGDREDYMLGAGEALCFERDDPVLLCAFDESRVDLSERAANGRARLRNTSADDALADALRRWLPRARPAPHGAALGSCA